MPIILDAEQRSLSNRANAKTKCFAAPSLKRTGGIKTYREQFTTQVEYRCMTAHAYACGRAAVRADEHDANWRLRKCLLAIIFQNDVQTKPVNF